MGNRVTRHVVALVSLQEQMILAISLVIETHNGMSQGMLLPSLNASLIVIGIPNMLSSW